LVVSIHWCQHVGATALVAGLVFDAQPQHLDGRVVISSNHIQQTLQAVHVAVAVEEPAGEDTVLLATPS
jgi:hypothetical protein